MLSKQQDKHISLFLIFLLFHIQSFTALSSILATNWAIFSQSLYCLVAPLGNKGATSQKTSPHLYFTQVYWQQLHISSREKLLFLVSASYDLLFPSKLSFSQVHHISLLLLLVTYCLDFFLGNSVNWLAIFHYFCGAMGRKNK